MAVAVDTCYISGACNRVPHCLDWGRNDLICYGVCNAVAVYDPKASAGGSTCKTLTTHKGRVNSVRWIKRPDNGAEFEILSTSSDRSAVVWTLQDGGNYRFKPSHRLEGHGDAVNVADAIYTKFEKRHKLVATASSDCTVKIWKLDETGVAICLQTMNLKSNFMHDVKFAFHHGTSVPFLITGGSDSKLHLYCQTGEEFTKVISLVGHEDWIRAIDITTESSGDLLIASSSQDCLIRLWRLTLDKDDAEDCEKQIKLKGNSFKVHGKEGEVAVFSIGLEAVNAGHEGWVYGLHWHPRHNDEQPMQLLSSSMDKTMILWEHDPSIGVWIEKVRVGEVGGNTLGFFGNRFSPSGESMIAHGFQGAFHMWHFEKHSSQWRPGVTVGGHFDEVLDLDWDSGGSFVVSVSSDQTTRLHAAWHKDGAKTAWYQMARPQVHGFDMTCVTVIGRRKFASGADEKVLRAFEAPKNFIENFERVCQVNLVENLAEKDSIPEGASVPALGLSNKAIFEKTSQVDSEARHQKDIYPEAYFSSTSLTEPPAEETLVQNTLWPEVHKMYGHGYEIFCVASNLDQTLLASACKASKPEHARIIIWSTANWKEIGQLSGHTLTVTQMDFSPCGRYLLSVSRDRTWSLHELQLANNGDLSITRVAFSDKSTCKHSRIIWSCSWSHDSKYFVTGSRDKKVIVWGLQANSDNKKSCLGQWGGCSSVLELEDAVTAVTFAPLALKDGSYLLAVGLESGSLYLYKWNCLQNTEWYLSHAFEKSFSHHLTVKRIRFNPVSSVTEDGRDVIQLASCGADHLLYIYNVFWKLL